ncbi:hypothetical protein M378DRAFT_11933 [Amanita muscaria Koide BX008]|uniref:Uncharacterized protein n=1 Tax=Amanita muscaria (strain Koide BX008) TaxID=946122 RepID=A0A0C2SKV2_AMAMK|nr:hypothetical protein M378DRAFT_11933 [Amanita muscaria Koide BX008]
MRPKFSLKSKRNSQIPSAFAASLGSQLARPYLASSSPSKLRDKAPVLITFDDWDKGGIFDWYQAQSHTAIHKLELRKERDRFKHEFVVLYLEGGSTYRVDRRPMGGPNTEVVLSKGCEAEDSITFLTDDNLITIQSETDVKVAVQFGSEKKPDLYAIIAICTSVRMDSGCALYTLQLYNCYFLARTITALIVRHHLLHCQDLVGLRWDALTESAVSRHMFPDNWSALDTAMKNALVGALGEAIWPIVKKDAELLIQKRKQWLVLEETTKRIIRETVETQVNNLIVDSIKTGAVHWAVGAASETLWHGDLDQNLSLPHFREHYEVAVEDILTRLVKPKLNTCLPSDVVMKLDGVLPKRLLNRLPSSLLALLPAELWARVPNSVLEKAPDDTIKKAPIDLLLKAPDEFLQRIPTQVFARAPIAQTLTLPDDLKRVPHRLLDVSLMRMQAMLEQPVANHDRALALRLLKRLPDDMLEEIPQRIKDMREEPEPVEILELSDDTDVADEPHPPTPATLCRRPSKALLHGYRWVVKIVFATGVRVVPRPVLAHMPGIVVELIPKSMLKAISADTLSRLPPGFFAGLRAPLLEKLPQELLEKLPGTLMKILPRETLERLPDGLLDRLPEQLLRNVPVELMENLPENLSDLVSQAIATEIFESHETTVELSNRTCDIMKAALNRSSDELPDSVIRISVESRSKMRHQQIGSLGTHRELQRYILDKNRKHSKRVAQVSQLGLGEEAVYNALRQKTEDVWRVMRLHSSPPTSAPKAFSRRVAELMHALRDDNKSIARPPSSRCRISS